jgi:hypothetical protein
MTSRSPFQKPLLQIEPLETRLAPAVFNVNFLGDILNPPAGVVSLRSAIQQANATPGDNTINLTVPGTYKITLRGANEDSNATGDLDILQKAGGGSLTIQNTSGGRVTVDANHLDRAFDINPAPLFTATLNGAQQVPPTGTPASGSATISLGAGESTIAASSSWTGLIGIPLAAHLHNAAAGSNGPLATDANGNNIEFAGVPPATSGTIPTQTFSVNPGFVGQLQSGNIYENIHTTAFPGGEIRGQFSAAPKFTVTMKGFTITNGNAAGGGAIRDTGNASLTLTNMVITNNTASGDGGGVVMFNTANAPWTLSLTNTTISNNHAGDAGGGIDTDGSGKVVLGSGTLITGNTSVNQGAGVWLDTIDGTTSASLSASGTVISNNKALSTGGVGGGIGNAGNGAITLLNSTLIGNFAGSTGGGFGDENNLGKLTLLGTTVLNNTSVGNGGGIAEAGPLTSITNSEIDGNSSGGSGGGLFIGGTQLLMQNSTVANNIASGNGGGLELETTGSNLTLSTITSSTFTGNLADNAGGANGGGIDANLSGSLLLQSDTINANTATGFGGGVFWMGAPGSSVGLVNTIVAGDSAQAGTDVASLVTFSAQLFGFNQVPPIPTPGSGTGTIVLAPDSTIAYSEKWVNLLGSAIAAHLHLGAPGTNGPKATDANGNNIELTGVSGTIGGVAAQTFTVTPGFVTALLAGNVYSNIHTTLFPAGEIRGQFSVSAGRFTDLGGNLIGVEDQFVSDFTDPTTLTGTADNPLDPMLGPLTNNGGPIIGGPNNRMTLQTESLMVGSPAIGNGLLAYAPVVDARGFPAADDNGLVNIGAVSAFVAQLQSKA